MNASARRLLVVGVDELLGLLEQVLGAVRLGVAAGLDEVEVGRRRRAGRGRPWPRSPARTKACASSPYGRRCCGFWVRVLRSVSWRVHSWSDDDALPRLVDELLAELDGLGQDDLFLGGQQGDLADLLEVHPDRVIDADHVGADGLEVLGGRLLDLLGVELGRPLGRQLGRRIERAVVGDDLDVHLGVGDPAAAASGPRSRSVVVVIVVVVVGWRRRSAPRAGRRPASLASSRSALARRGPREDGLHELLVERIGGHGFLLG